MDSSVMVMARLSGWMEHDTKEGGPTIMQVATARSFTPVEANTLAFGSTVWLMDKDSFFIMMALFKKVSGCMISFMAMEQSTGQISHDTKAST